MLPDATVLAHLTDAHCHAGEHDMPRPEDMDALPIRICVMSSRLGDQTRTRALAEGWKDKVIPAFGYHPWWSHHIALKAVDSAEEHYRMLFLPTSEAQAKYEDAFARVLPSLPEPRLLSDVLEEVRVNLTDFPNAMLGEVGLDQAARIPFSFDEAKGERRELSPFTIPLGHQRAILEAQMDLAVELRRNISLHSVKAPLPTREVLDAMAARHRSHWRAISIDLHACGMSPEMYKDIEKHHPNAFLSLARCINGRSQNHLALIRAANPQRLLVESDYPLAKNLAAETWAMVETIAKERGWRLEQTWDYEELEDGMKDNWGVVRRLEANWRRFEKGDHPAQRVMNRKRRTDFSYEEYPDSDTSD
ncbi:unnamed protein product [Peniophora sp. CBMAI 1063]|nr:unnamed protein product [Peniophora sp. CBMAI 1063]